jgi:hypothetical protein
MGNFQEAMEHIAKGLAILVMEGMGDQLKALVPPPPKRAYNLKDAAEYCGIGKSTLHDYKKKGRIETHLVGNRPKYYVEDLDKLLAEMGRNNKKAC